MLNSITQLLDSKIDIFSSNSNIITDGNASQRDENKICQISKTSTACVRFVENFVADIK